MFDPNNKLNLEEIFQLDISERIDSFNWQRCNYQIISAPSPTLGGGLGWKVTWHLNGQSRARRMSPTFEEILLIGGRRMERPALDKRQKPLILGWWVDFELWTRLRKLAAVELLVSVRKLVSQFSLFWGGIQVTVQFNLRAIKFN